jgi:quercetin dioxygenase-like cupin family protein
MSAPKASLQPCIRQPSEHQRLAYTGGSEVAILLDAAITGGQLTVVDTYPRRGDASPVHVHHHDDEVFLLLEGAMTVWVGDERRQLQAGGFAFLPREIPHAVRYDADSRALILCTPAGHQEIIFRTAGWDLSKPLPDDWQVSPEEVRAAAERAGNTVLGPPHGLAD